jgi:stage V sporulation protein AC
MNKENYKKIIKKHKPKEDIFKNTIIAFISGGVMGIIGQGLIDFYSSILDISSKDASSLMIVTLVFIGVLLTGLGFFDKWVNYFKCGLIIPITGFAHSMMSATMEYKKEGLITGIGSNMFKLSGTVIAYGVISATIFGFIRLLIGG